MFYGAGAIFVESLSLSLSHSLILCTPILFNRPIQNSWILNAIVMVWNLFGFRSI